MADARTTLTRAIANLPPSCVFNVVGFGSSYDSLFVDAMPANEANIAKALKYVQTSKANMGGTELWRPLCALYALDEKLGDRTRNIFLLTDGQLVVFLHFACVLCFVIYHAFFAARGNTNRKFGLCARIHHAIVRVWRGTQRESPHHPVFGNSRRWRGRGDSWHLCRASCQE